MAENATWMDEIIEDQTDDWMDGYVFAQGNICAYIQEYDMQYDPEQGCVFVYLTDLEEEE